MRTQIGTKRLPLTFAVIVMVLFTPRARGLDYSQCAQTVSNNPNISQLRDKYGKPTNNLKDAWGISYPTCQRLCSTDDNAAHSNYNWNYLAQGVGSWLLVSRWTMIMISRRSLILI